MNKYVFVAASLVAVEASAAESFKLTTTGFLDTQIGAVQEKKLFQKVEPFDNADLRKKERFAITNDTKLDFKADFVSKNGLKYGGYIRLNTDTSVNASDNGDNVADKTMIYVQSNFGRVEMGAYDSVSKQMQVSANSITTVSGGIDGYAPKWFSQKTSDGRSAGAHYVIWPELLTNCDCISYANKVTYITPKFNGFQVGVSYTPDISTHGTVSRYRAVPKNDNGNFRDLFDFGVTYEGKFKDVSTKVGLIAQHGKSKSLTVARKDLNAFELGAVVEYKGFSVAGSYSDWFKSATPKVQPAGKKYGAKYWTAGVAYEKQAFKTSLTYFEGRRASVYSAPRFKDDGTPHPDTIPTNPANYDAAFSKSQYASLGVDYKLAPGFTPYAEVTAFKFKNGDRSAANSGAIYLLGTRLSF